MATAEWDGYQNLQVKLAALAAPDPTPLLERWEKIIVEGNRRGVLRGVDGYNRPMPPLKYRNGKGKAARNRTANFGINRRAPHGDNLTSTEYARLTGPRLAPRGEKSRVITNLLTQHGREGANTWFASARWFDVVSEDGKPFLPYHFDGTGHMPRYDLRPVRPEDLELAALNAREWVTQLFA